MQIILPQVKNRRVRRKIIEVGTEVMFGTTEAAESVLEALGQRINMALIGRINRTSRIQVPGWDSEGNGWPGWNQV